MQVDAFGDDGSFDLGTEHKVKLEARLRLLEEGNLRRISGTAKAKSKFEKYHVKTEVKPYPTEADSTLPTTSKKRKHSEIETPKKLIEELPDADADTEPKSEKKKKKKKKDAEAEDVPETPVKKIKTEVSFSFSRISLRFDVVDRPFSYQIVHFTGRRSRIRKEEKEKERR